MSWIPPGFQSLKVRAIAVILSIVLLTVGALAMIVSAVLRVELESLLANQQGATVSLVASGINFEFAERTRALELVATWIDSQTMAHPAQAQALLNDRAVLKVLFNAGYFLTKLDGFAIAEFPVIGRVGLNYLDRDHVVSALKMGKAMIGRPVIAKAVKSPSFAMTIPVRDAAGQVIGALTGATDLTKPNFLDSLDAAYYGRTGGYLIVDPKDRLFVTATQNNKSLVMQPLPAPGVNRVFDQRLLGFDGSAVNINSLGKEVLTTSGRIPAAGWFVISTLPTNEAFETIHKVNIRLAIAAGFASLLAIFITWWSVNRLLSPLQKAALDVSRMAEERAANSALPIARLDEVGKLIEGFNKVMRVSAEREQALRESENQIRQLSAMIH